MGVEIKRFFNFKYILLLFFVCAGIFCFSNSVSGADDINPIVRVAISNNNFKTFVYNEISIIATGNFGLYNKNTSEPVVKFNINEIAKVKYKEGKFEILKNDKVVASNLSGEYIFDCRNGILGVDGLKRSGKQALYHGNLEIVPKDLNSFFVINVLDLQQYLKGVVPNEMPIKFGLEALKAQAVAARNYVLMPRTRT